VAPARRLQVPTSHAGVAVTGDTARLVGGENGSTMLGTVQMMKPNPSFGSAGAPGAGSPYFGDKLLVADRGNNRLLLMDAAMIIDWTYPNATTPANPDGFYFPDDAFFAKRGSVIISNQEENESGRPVVAVATTAKAVAELSGAGLDARTIARLRMDLANGPLASGTIVVLDEIPQTPTGEVEAVLAAVDACPGGQLRVLGDPRQSQPAGAGGAADHIENLAADGVISGGSFDREPSPG
jgi:hypothetical protein